MSEPANTSHLPADDRDLYCLECGYNLRGLWGDPRRCPECGHMNPMGDIELPAQFIREQMRRLESAPAYCVLFLFLLVVGAVFTVAAAANELKALPIGLGLLAIGGIGWPISAEHFQRSCLSRPGWRKALAQYHFYAGAICLAMLGGFSIWTIVGSLSQARPSVAFACFVPLLIGVLVLVGARWAQQRGRRLMEPLQRDVAVQLAREALRRRLDTERGFSKR